MIVTALKTKKTQTASGMDPGHQPDTPNHIHAS
jgi:hypothetical protein